MKESDFSQASVDDRKEYVLRPYDEVPLTKLVEGSFSHLVSGQNAMISFLTMKAGSIFEIHSHPEEQIMIVIEGYCDEIIGDKIYRVREGDVIRLPPNVPHGAFLREVDCKAIDIFAPGRSDYANKFREQHPETGLLFTEISKENL